MTKSMYNSCELEYFDISNSLQYEHMCRNLKQRLDTFYDSQRMIVILCIGTDRATGDSLGPLVGDRLSTQHQNLVVYGTLSNPVHALNLTETIATIRKTYDNPYIIAIDAALGSPAHIGHVTISNCPIAPGKGVNKKLPIIGDLSITGIVNVAGKHEHVLSSTRLYTVVKLADAIVDSLNYSLTAYD